MERRAAEGECPLDEMVAHGFEHADPAVGDRNTGIDFIEIKKADAKARRECGEGHSGEEEKCVKSWIGGDGHGLLCQIQPML